MEHKIDNRLNPLLLIWALFGVLLALAPLAQATTISLPSTGQNLCYNMAGGVISCAGTGQDGELQAGVAWPTPRFTDNGNGTVTDLLTGLVWLKDAGCATFQPSTGITWDQALSASNALKSGQCGLTDGSVAGDWRLPNVTEIESLIDLSQYYHPLPAGHPFQNVQWGYWTSTTLVAFPGNAECVAMDNGGVMGCVKTNLSRVWPVKGGTTALARTGQTTCWNGSGIAINCSNTGQDADKKTGVAWPVPRFVDQGIGTVADRMTGLVWLKNADCYGDTTTQDAAIGSIRTLADGFCGLADRSVAGQWRLPNRKELRSLLNLSQTDGGTWLTSQGFLGAYNAYYWTSDSYPNVVDLNWLPPGADPNLGDKWMVRSLGGSLLSSWVTDLVPHEIKHVMAVRNRVSPVISWANPTSIPWGTPLSGTELDASANVPGTFAYSPAAGTALGLGSAQLLSVSFTPQDQDNYLPTTKTVTIDVAKATATVTLGGLSATYDGSPKPVSATSTPAGKNIVVTYGGSSAPPTGAGSYGVLATVVDANYSGSATGQLVIAKAPLAVLADAKSKAAGAADPPLTYRFSGLASGDTAGLFSGSLSRDGGETPGSYGITQGTLSAGANYAVNFTGAQFTIDTPSFSVTFVSSGNGTLSGAASQSVVQGGATSAVTAVPSTGYHLVNWTGAGGILIGTANPIVITSVTSAQAIAANFALDTFTVTPVPDANGSTDPAAPRLVSYNGSTSFTLIPAAGYRVVSGSGCGGTLSGTSFVTGPVSANCSVTIAFGPIGDVNGDGRLDIADAVLALRMAVKIVELTPAQLAAGDVGPLSGGKLAPDGSIDVADALLILEKVVGLNPW